MRGLIVVVASCIVAALPAVAGASRPATDQEVAGMAAALGVDAACVTATVSTVDETYARVTGVIAPGCPMGNGFRILRRSGEGWRSQPEISGSDTSVACARYAHVMPARVARDLRICTPVSPVPRLVCNAAGGIHKARQAPGDCVIFPDGAPLSDGIDLHRLHWRHWGDGSAFTQGVSRGLHLYGPWVDIDVVAYRLRLSSCGAPYRVYTRVKVTSRYGGRVYKPDPC